MRVGVWVFVGRYELVEKLLFAFIDPLVVVADVPSFLRTTQSSMVPHMAVDLLPLFLGAMILQCY